MRRQQLSIVELHKIDLLRNPRLLQDQLALVETMDRAKLRKMLKQTTAGNVRFQRYIANHNLLDMRSEGLVELINRAFFDDGLMQGFATFFEKTEQAKMAELEKDNTRIQDQLKNYQPRKVGANHHVYQTPKQMRIPSRIKSPECGISQEIRQFEQRYGQFDFVGKKQRLMSTIIDEAYSKIWNRQLQSVLEQGE